MSLWRIQGGERLSGSLTVQGAKNAVLPMLAAAVLAPCETELTNCPCLRDVDAAADILRCLGCTVERREDVLYIDARGVSGCGVSRGLTRAMRSSVLFLGGILGRCGEARISLPGGCRLGERPVDLHLAAMEALGATVECRDGEIFCAAPDGLTGGTVYLPIPSVGATENAMIAACAARGRTTIINAAREPEIAALQGFLRAMGADIRGGGEPIITVDGFRPREKLGWRVMPDRICAATLLCACACAGGDVELRGVDPGHFAPVTERLAAMGCRTETGRRFVRLRREGRLSGGGTVITRPYPGFPTDAQPLLMAASLQAEGTTVFVENIFSDRFRQAAEMTRLGADIRIAGRVAVVNGVESLHGAPVLAEDLRGGAALILAGLGAAGETLVTDRGHVRRGYDGLDTALRRLGARVECDITD